MNVSMNGLLTHSDVKTLPGYKPYRTLNLDCLKLYTVAHGHKVSPPPFSSSLSLSLVFDFPRHLTFLLGPVLGTGSSSRGRGALGLRLMNSQTTNLIINLDHDEWILNDLSKKLVDVGAGTFDLSHSPSPNFLVSRSPRSPISLAPHLPILCHDFSISLFGSGVVEASANHVYRERD